MKPTGWECENLRREYRGGEFLLEEGSFHGFMVLQPSARQSEERTREGCKRGLVGLGEISVVTGVQGFPADPPGLINSDPVLWPVKGADPLFARFPREVELPNFFATPYSFLVPVALLCLALFLVFLYQGTVSSFETDKGVKMPY